MVPSKDKVCFIFSGDFPEGNTKNTRLKSLSEALVNHGIRCEFYSMYPYPFSKTLFAPQPKNWFSTKVTYFSIVRKHPSAFILRVIQLILSHIYCMVWTVFQASKNTIYYYHNPRWADTLPSFLINTMLGRICIVDQTELFSTIAKPKWHKSEERVISKRADILLVLSEPLRRYFKVMRSKPIYILPVIVDLERFKHETKEQKYLIGYLGSFTNNEGINTILEATKILVRINKEIRLRLIGYYPDIIDLKKTVNSLDLSDNVEITGTVTSSEIPWLLKECDTLLLNSEASEYSKYSFPIKLGEYFASKKPVILNDSSSFSDYFEHRNEVFKFTTKDVNSLVEVIQLRYANYGEADAVASRGYQYAENFFDSKKLGSFFTNIVLDLFAKKHRDHA
jgi:glycosyltransferase involved in cell wall biosynthesis